MRIKLQMTTICGRQKNNDSFFVPAYALVSLELKFILNFRFFEGKKHKLIG